MSIVQDQLPVVLAIEEDRAIGRLLVLGLAQHGFRVVPVYSGEEALEFLQTSFQAIDVVLIDQETSWPGWQATLLALRQVKPFLPCGILGSDGQEKEQILKAGACLLPKPFGLVLLATCVRNLLKEAMVARRAG